MTPHEIAWRDGYALVLPAEGVVRLRAALEHNDNRIVQHHAVCPVGWGDKPCTAADPIGFALWEPGDTVDQLGKKWLDAFMHVHKATRYAATFIVWMDGLSRGEMRAALCRLIDGSPQETGE